MTTAQKLRARGSVLALVLSVAALVVSYARTTWITENSGQVIVRMPTCADADWRVCQHIALVHLAQAIDKHPNANQYKVRWCGQWFPLVTYDQKERDLQEVNVGQADMDYCSHATAKSIHAAARTTGGFDALAKYGADYNPL